MKKMKKTVIITSTLALVVATIGMFNLNMNKVSAQQASSLMGKIVDNLPAGFEVISSGTTPGYTQSGDVVTWDNLSDFDDNGEITVTLRAKVRDGYCGNTTLSLNPINTVLGYMNNVLKATASSIVQVKCPLRIEGDIGSRSGSVNNSEFKIEKDTIVTSAGGISNVTGGTHLTSYPYGSGTLDKVFAGRNDNSQIQVFEKLLPFAKNLSQASTSASDLGIYKASGNLGSIYSNVSLLLMTGTNNIDISSGFGNNSGKGMGIVKLEGGDININGGNNFNIKDVAIYAPYSTVTINSSKQFNYSGMIVAKEINFNTQRGGNVVWSGKLAKEPPVGLADLLKALRVSEVAPE